MPADFPSDGHVRAAAHGFADALAAATEEIYYATPPDVIETIQGWFQAPDVDAARHELLEGCERALVFRPEV